MLGQKGLVVTEERDLGSRPLDVGELERLIGDRDYKDFLNPRNELYRERAMKTKPPSRSEALKLMAANPNLIRRPILVGDGALALGFDEEEWTELTR